MKSVKWNGIILTCFLLFMLAGQAGAQLQKLYISVPEENFRIAPNGRKIGTLLKGTEMTVLQEQDNWVKVQVTGWIWRPSTTGINPNVATGKYRALHILVKNKDTAEKILQQLREGADFAELARKYSVAPSSEIGGDLGYFNKGDFSSTIENAILSLKVGETSGIVQTEFGYNIFKRLK